MLKVTDIQMNTENNKNTSKGANYLGLAFQMGVLIFIATYGGMILDKKIGTHPLFVILFSLLSIAFSMYYIIRKETYKKKKDE
jgi:F0F1-type ATP synthase assembly protein I